MKIFNILKNQKGVTLIEAMVAILVLTIGVISAMGMQVRAIGASSSAVNRTSANNVVFSLLETLRQLPFDDPNLVETVASPNALVNDANDRVFVAGGFPEMQSLIQAGAVAGTIVDRSGIIYQLSWDVQDRILATGETLNKTIRVFMIWNSPMGQNRLEMTTIKYNNISL
ncbi:MAG: prepilin-type N-terminal cleavage/methylation domain-containing protein [Pseudomonadota bacterium]